VLFPTQKGLVYVSEELRPYIVYRMEDGQIECAIWQLKEGEKALALFLSADTAMAYRDATQADAAWHVFRPTREGLVQLIRACYQVGIRFAVLDPDREKAKQIFDLEAVLAVVGE
jgi:hypothetical protein